MLAGWILVAVLSTQTDSSGGLLAAAAASGRPRECASSARRGVSRGPSVWEVARVPNLQRYCDLVARAQAQLAATPDAARESAELADKALPGRASPAVIRGRAALALGDVDVAAKAFTRAQEIDPRSLEEPAAMYNLARVLSKTGKPAAALAIYRALVPRVDLLPTADRRVAVLLEAAHASMALEAASPGDASAAKPGDKTKLDEAIAYLREARQRPPTQYTGDVLLSLVLALDRAGDRAQADAALGDAQRLGARTRSGNLDYVAVPEDKQALEALALEADDRPAAIKSWEAFLAGPGGKGAWAAPARARVEALRKGGSKPAASAAGKSESKAAKPAKPRKAGKPK